MDGTDPGLDFVLEAGPRVVTPDTPEHAVEEIGKYRCFGPFRIAMRQMKLEAQAEIVRLIKRTCRENRELEKIYRGTAAIMPDARIPIDLVYALEAQEKISWNAEMREDTLRCYPGLRLNVKR
jgi:hypothetical protein